jgi:peptidyl-prolyl cis-trans isomerase C/foldase protein PrsA
MKINGEPVDPELLSGEFQRLMQTQADRPDEVKVSEEDVKRIAEDSVITRILLVNEGRKRHPEISQKDLKRKQRQLARQYGPTVNLDAFRAHIEDDVRVDRIVSEAQEKAPRPTADEARSRFEEDPSVWAAPEQVHCSHIVRHIFGGADPNASLQQILEAQRLLRSGQPFEEVTRQFSDQHGQAGDLGTFARGHMVDSFENVVFAMKPGEISDVFKTEFGYHIVLLHEKTPAQERTFEDAKADILHAMRQERKEQAVESLVASLKSAAVIERD